MSYLVHQEVYSSRVIYMQYDNPTYSSYSLHNPMPLDPLLGVGVEYTINKQYLNYILRVIKTYLKGRMLSALIQIDQV